MAARAPDWSSIGHNHIIASLVCVCLVALSSNVWAQAGAEEFDFGLYSDALVDDPSAAGPASYHLLKAPWDSSVALHTSGGIGLTRWDGASAIRANVGLRRSGRLEIGARLLVDAEGAGFKGAVLGLRHQIHAYLAWGISGNVRDRGNAASDQGGTSVFMARARSVAGLPVGSLNKLGLELGDEISVDGVGLRASSQFDGQIRGLTVIGGVQARSVKGDRSGAIGVDGWLGVQRDFATTRLRLSIDTGLGAPGVSVARAWPCSSSFALRSKVPPPDRHQYKQPSATSLHACLTPDEFLSLIQRSMIFTPRFIKSP